MSACSMSAMALSVCREAVPSVKAAQHQRRHVGGQQVQEIVDVGQGLWRLVQPGVGQKAQLQGRDVVASIARAWVSNGMASANRR